MTQDLSALVAGLTEVPWTLAYIEDAATARRVIMWRGRVADPCASNYSPPDNGVHLCGQTDDRQQPTTVASYPMSPAEARELFDLAKAVAECPSREEEDFIVDLCLRGEIGENFSSNRQLWPRATEAWNSRATPPVEELETGA